MKIIVILDDAGIDPEIVRLANVLLVIEQLINGLVEVQVPVIDMLDGNTTRI